MPSSFSRTCRRNRPRHSELGNRAIDRRFAAPALRAPTGRAFACVCSLALGTLVIPRAVAVSASANAPTPAIRVPAEWEPQAGVWMQWPRFFEASYRPEFAAIVRVLLDYEPVHMLAASNWEKRNARNYLAARGVDPDLLEWHVKVYDWAWMRDNGPIWVEADGVPAVEDWRFDGWGGLVPYWQRDDMVPCQVAVWEDAPCRTIPIINERGTLEFNGSDVVVTSWPVLHDRNPGRSRAALTANLERAFGVDRVVWLESAPSDDLTKGHVDGIARFIDAERVAVARYVDQSHPDAWVYEEAAAIIAAAGLQVERVDVPGSFTYRNIQMSAVYMNWLVLNDAVLMTGFAQPAWDEAARQRVQEFFPDRDVQLVDTRELWYWGGGVHCVTNDQPRAE
jgi:agmatine deiminase